MENDGGNWSETLLLNPKLFFSILHFHVTSEKLKLKFLPSSGKSHFKTNICWPVFSSVDRFVLKIEHGLNPFFSQCVTSALFLGNMLRARKYRFALSFRVLSNKYVERSVYANVFKFNRENKRCVREKVNRSRFFHWFTAAMLESNMASPY